MVSVAGFNSREDARAMVRRGEFQMRALAKEVCQQLAIYGEDRLRPIGEPIEASECDHAQSLGSMGSSRIHEILDQPHPPRKLRFREYPTASKAAQSVCFGQTARADELVSQMECRTRCFISTFEI